MRAAAVLPVRVKVKVPVVRPASVAVASVAATVTTGMGVKVAIQLRLVVMVTLPSPQSASPDQPLKRDPVSALAVKVTTVLGGYGSVQSIPQLIPAGLLVTVPAPVPVLVTIRRVGLFEINSS